MPNNITIKITNCCNPCGTSGSTGTTQPPIDVWPDPDSTDGPPVGYLEAGAISDRQCKTAVFMYEWAYGFLDGMVNTTPGNWLVNFLNSAGPNVVQSYVLTVVGKIIAAVFVTMSTAGPDISDLVTGPLAWHFAGVLIAYILEAFNTQNITLPLLSDILTKLPAYRDRIICEMAQATDHTEVYTRLETVLDDELGMTDGQRAIFFATIPPQLLQLLYWSAEWWPSFETETLPSITETCCGSLTPGQPLLPGSTIRCNAANYVFDLLVQLFSNTHEAVTGYSAFPLIPLDVEQFIYDDLQGGNAITGDESLVVPPKITATAYSMPQFFRGLSRYMAHQYTFGNWIDDLANDTTFSGLVDHFGTNEDAIICALYTSLNAAGASTALIDEVQNYLATTALSAEEQIYVHDAIMGIIHASGNFINLLFTQDSAILNYTGNIACDGCGWVDPGASDNVFDFEVSDQGWEINYDMSNPNPEWRYRGPGYTPEAFFHSGDISGAGTAKLAIYYPTLVSLSDVIVYPRGTTEKLNYLKVFTSDDMVNWTQVASVQGITANWVTPHTFTDLAIVNKYVLVYAQIYWAGASASIVKVEFNV